MALSDEKPPKPAGINQTAASGDETDATMTEVYHDSEKEPESGHTQMEDGAPSESSNADVEAQRVRHYRET